MREEWKTYWAEMWRYLRCTPLGLLIAAIPFCMALPYYRQAGLLVAGALISGVFGLVIPLSVWLCNGAVYAALIQLAIKAGRKFEPPLALNILSSTVGLALGVWLAMAINHRLFGSPIAGEVFFGSMIFGGLVITLFIFYYIYRQSREESLASRAEAAEARFHALENQMRPHFLFNALNSLAELIESGQENAAETAYKLSELYRRILANSGLKTARLDSEIEVVRLYLELEQLRFGARLSFTIDAPNEEIYLPSLMLQTLVENAVKHGVAPAIGGGQIWILVNRRADGFQLNIINTGAPYQPNDNGRNGQGLGLANTRARLNLLYGDSHGFKIESDAAARTVARFNFTGKKID